MMVYVPTFLCPPPPPTHQSFTPCINGIFLLARKKSVLAVCIVCENRKGERDNEVQVVCSQRWGGGEGNINLVEDFSVLLGGGEDNSVYRCTTSIIPSKMRNFSYR